MNELLFDGKKALKGYMVGDAFNSALETLAESLKDGIIDGGVNGEALAAQFSYFEYEYYDDGWHAKKDDKKVHPVLNAFLTYKLDGSEELKLSDEMIGHYKDDTLLYIAGYKDDGKYNALLALADESGVIDTLMHAKVGDIAKICSGDKQKVAEGLNAIAGELTVKQIATLLGYAAGETTPAFATRIGAKKLSEVAAFISKTDEEQVAELKVIFKDTTVGEVADFLKIQLTDETERAKKVEAILDDYLAFVKGDYTKKVELVEKLLGEKTAVELLTAMQIPLRTDMQDKKLTELSKQADSEAEGDFNNYLVGLFNAVYSYVDPDEASALLDSILKYEVIPGVTVSDVVGALSSKDAFAPIAYKFYTFLGGTELDEAAFSAKLDEVFYPFLTKLKGVFNEEKLVGDYTIAGLIEALQNEETSEAAKAAIEAQIEKLKDEVYATEWLTKLSSTLTKAVDEIQKFAETNLYDLVITVGEDTFTIGDAAAYVKALMNGEKVDENNSLYKILDKITVDDVITAIKNAIDSGNEPNEPGDVEINGDIKLGKAA